MRSPLAVAIAEIKYKDCFICFSQRPFGRAAIRTSQNLPDNDGDSTAAAADTDKMAIS